MWIPPTILHIAGSVRVSIDEGKRIVAIEGTTQKYAGTILYCEEPPDSNIELLDFSTTTKIPRPGKVLIVVDERHAILYMSSKIEGVF